jgi:hypothetical protein
MIRRVQWVLAAVIATGLLVPGVLLSCLLVSTAVRADDPMQIAVVGYGKVPAGTALATETTDNGELTTQVDQNLRQALTGKGFTLSDDAGYVFSVTADTTGRTDSSLGAGPQNNAQVHITLDTSQNAFVGGATLPPNKIPHTFRITLNLYERSSGHYVWRGEITDMRPDADPMRVTGPMVDKLVQSFEKSVGAPQ